MANQNNSPESESLLVKNPQQYSEINHGLRVPEMDLAGLSDKWLVDGKLPLEHWARIRTQAIPIMYIGEIVPESIQEQLKARYGDLFFVLIPDLDMKDRWSANGVFYDDMYVEDPETLLVESQSLVMDLEGLTKADLIIADMKRHAYLLITGHHQAPIHPAYSLAKDLGLVK